MLFITRKNRQAWVPEKGKGKLGIYRVPTMPVEALQHLYYVLLSSLRCFYSLIVISDCFQLLYLNCQDGLHRLLPQKTLQVTSDLNLKWVDRRKTFFAFNYYKTPSGLSVTTLSSAMSLYMPCWCKISVCGSTRLQHHRKVLEGITSCRIPGTPFLHSFYRA